MIFYDNNLGLLYDLIIIWFHYMIYYDNNLVLLNDLFNVTELKHFKFLPILHFLLHVI